MMIRRVLNTVPRSPGGRGRLMAVVVAFVALRLAETLGDLPGWLGSWGDDLICLPFVLTMALSIHRLAGRSAGWTLPWSHAAAVFVLYTVYFELILPRSLPSAVGDPLDVAAYAAGGVFFLLALNVPGGRRCLSRQAGTCGPR